MARMSRRIPPTPVAAPWNGSTADGWLWLSTLNVTACPSPRSITPAFSPGPWSTRGPVDGKRPQERRECLYAQCSDQSSEKTASSKWFGSRLEQLADPVQLVVRQAERSMERLGGDRRQMADPRRPSAAPALWTSARRAVGP